VTAPFAVGSVRSARLGKLEIQRLVGGPTRGKRTKELAQLTEQLGYHHLWVYDHFEDRAAARAHACVRGVHHVGRPRAAHVDRSSFGQMVTCAALPQRGDCSPRKPRASDVFLGRSLDPRYRRRLVRPRVSGVRPSTSRVPGERLAILEEETVEVIKKLWTEETVDVPGEAHRVRRAAYCDPKPIQQLPELWIGGGAARR